MKILNVRTRRMGRHSSVVGFCRVTIVADDPPHRPLYRLFELLLGPLVIELFIPAKTRRPCTFWPRLPG